MDSVESFEATLSDVPVPEIEAALEPSTRHGADFRFHGVVRDREDGAPIQGIDYSAYESMALREFEKIGAAMAEEHPEHLARVHHRTGFVPAGEASLLIRVQTKHSAEGFEILRDYLRRIKETVPVWKKIVE